MSINQDKIKAVIRKIWSKLPNPQPMSGNDIVNKIDEVYEAGKTELWNNMWDSIQIYGSRTTYVSYFYRWKTDNFYPKYDFVLSGASNAMFNMLGRYTDDEGKDHVDTPINLIERLNECGVSLDTSGVTNGNYMFQYACVTHLPIINLTSITNRTGMFGSSSLLYIEKIILSENGTNLSGAFDSTARSLEHVLFEGVLIGNFNISCTSKLDKESIESIVNCALNANTVSLTFSEEAVNKAFETSEGANDGSTSAEWATLIGTKPNCTISLA